VIPVPDQLDDTARQVRLDNRDDGPVHKLAAAWSDPWLGMSYRTHCCRVLAGAEGAILTTREATCGPCRRGGRCR
jgi:hypothetical protein